MAQADGRAVRGIRQDGQARALLAVRLPAALDALHESPAQTQRTRNARTPTRDAGRPHPDSRTSTSGHWTPNAWTSHAWTLDGHTGRRTPDAWTRPTTRTGRLGTPGIRTDILDHHDHPTARWDAEPWTCGRRLRRSATMTARRGWVSASARLPTALPAPARSLRRPGRASAHCSPRKSLGSRVARDGDWHPLCKWRLSADSEQVERR